MNYENIAKTVKLLIFNVNLWYYIFARNNTYEKSYILCLV